MSPLVRAGHLWWEVPPSWTSLAGRDDILQKATSGQRRERRGRGRGRRRELGELILHVFLSHLPHWLRFSLFFSCPLMCTCCISKGVNLVIVVVLTAINIPFNYF